MYLHCRRTFSKALNLVPRDFSEIGLRCPNTIDCNFKIYLLLTFAQVTETVIFKINLSLLLNTLMTKLFAS
jgi:hypothetical protein